MRSALILAGGRGRRLGYKEKALLPLNNRTVLEHIIDVLERLADEVIISVRDVEQQCLLEDFSIGRKVVIDQYHGMGPLAGILEGLKIANGDYVFIAACDMPYLNSKVVELLFDRACKHDAAIPVRENEMLEPLHAVYRAGPMAIETEKAILRNDKIVLVPIFNLKDVVFVDISEIRNIDPDLRTFMNINTREDMRMMKEE
ncbi:MAG: molybdenum cofactor guanylyltransferase [ANME-2 cluster archaeon]|nr:molybdenum cofactor guanylyltransferase [ANME-2 cluster archaeon]